MTDVEYVRSFLHDPYGDRWTDSTIKHHIERAKEHLLDLASGFIKTREINRKKSHLSSKTIIDKTAKIQLVNGKSTYKVDDDNLVAIKSLIYDNVFVNHANKDDKECTDGEKVVRSYSSAGLPKGVFKLSPTPNTKPNVCDAFKCHEKTKECDIVDRTNCCPTVEIVEHIDDYYLYGWGFEEQITPWVDKIKVDISNKKDDIKEVVPIELQPIEVVYQVKDIAKFDNNDAEVISDLVNDKEAIKTHVCGQLLRFDRDSLSTKLGDSELQLFKERVSVVLAKYQELYETDDVVELEMQELGNVSKVVSVSKLVEANENKSDASAKRNKVSEMEADERIEKYNARKACTNRYDSLSSKAI